MIHFYMTPTFLLPDPNTQILYACDSCGDKFLDASSLAQHVRIHTAQALVMFQADSDFYQYTTTATTEGDTTTTCNPPPSKSSREGSSSSAPRMQREGRKKARVWKRHRRREIGRASCRERV